MVGIIIIGMKVISIARVKGKSISVGFGYYNGRVQVHFPKNQQLRIQ